MEKNYCLPRYPWEDYEIILKQIAELELVDGPGNFLLFLQNIGFLNEGGVLTEQGNQYYQSRYIRLDGTHKSILVDALVKFHPAQAILQLLFGVKNANVDNVISIIKSRGFWDDKAGYSNVINLLSLLNSIGLVVYSKKFRTVKVIHCPSPNADLPSCVFIDSTRPFSNILWFNKILSNCRDFMYWIDKHFQKEALEYIRDIADANNLKEIKVLSISIPANSDQKTKRLYCRLKKELANKGIKLVWHVIDHNKIKDNHDRWIVTKNNGWNLPPVNSIISGQRAEIHQSSNYKEIAVEFKKYFDESREL